MIQNIYGPDVLLISLSILALIDVKANIKLYTLIFFQNFEALFPPSWSNKSSKNVGVYLNNDKSTLLSWQYKINIGLDVPHDLCIYFLYQNKAS